MTARLTFTGKPLERPVYSQIAVFYDKLMDHVDYESWAEYIHLLFEIYGNDVKTVIDGGCGTGQMIKALEKRNFMVYGFDLSLSMIMEAKKRCNGPLWQGDLRTPALNTAQDAFICLYDTIHYLAPDSMHKMFDTVYQVLKPDGLLIFDAVTENHILEYWADYTEMDQIGKYHYTRRSWYNAGNRSQHTEFEIGYPSGETFHEHHCQWIIPLADFASMGENCGFKLAGMLESQTQKSGDEKSDRIHFILRKDKK